MDDDRDGDDPNWGRAGRWFVLWGLGIGIVYMLVYRGVWKLFGEYEQLRLIPAGALLVVDQAFFGYRQVAGSAYLAGRLEPRSGPGAGTLRLPAVLAVVLIILVRFTLLLSLPEGARSYPPGWRANLGWLIPAVMYCPLLLMPVWGRFSMMLALSMGRVCPEGSPRLKRLAEGNRLGTVMLVWLAAAGLTVLYCSPEVGQIPRGVVIGLGVILVAYLVSFGLSRWCGGQSEATVAVAGLAGELAFLAFYLPQARAIYFY